MTVNPPGLLKVYVAGMTPAARVALANLKQVCQQFGGDKCYEIEVVDINENPQAAEDESILATPTVVKHRPAPARRVIGDLSDHEAVVAGLELGTDASK